MKRLFLLFSLTILCFSIFAQQKRYTETIFPSSTITADVVYDTAPFINFPYHNESSTGVDDLVMDIYEPTGDPHDLRAAIVFVHSGGFALGNRNHDDMVAFCDSFARKGYVTATIDYRKGFYLLSNAGMHATRAAYRGLQDGRSAIRYLRANAASYGIDPNRIYMAGSSAGAFVALHSIYMTDPLEKPVDAGAVSYSNIVFPFFHNGPDLGPFDTGSNLSQSGTPNGIISLWGAVVDLALVSPGDVAPVYMAHGTDDATVPFDSGAPFGVASFPTVYGSELINNALDANGFINKETYFLDGGGHEFYGTSNGSWANGSGGNAYWDILLPNMANFLWLQHKPTANFSFQTNDLTVNLTDLTSGSIGWFWDFGDGNTSTQQSPSHTYAVEGTYEVKLFVQNDILSCDELSMPVNVLAPLPVSWTKPLTANYEPEGYTDLNWTVAEQVNNDRFIIEHSLNGRDFFPIGTIDGLDNSLTEMAYNYRHKAPSVGINYYRIQQVDFDGRFDYSTIASVAIGNSKKSFSFYPNPAQQSITLVLEDTENQQLDIYNLQGVLLKSVTINSNRTKIELNDLAAGMYFIKMKNKQEFQKLMLK